MQRTALLFNWGRRLRATEELGVVGALLALALGLALLTDSFLRTGNLLDVARQASDYGIMAVGMVFLLSMGEIDLSVGSVVTLVDIVTAMAMRAHVAAPLAVLLGISTGAFCGFL